MTTDKPGKSSPPDPPAKDDAGAPQDRSADKAPGHNRNMGSPEKDRPINISTADDVDIDTSGPDEDAGKGKP